MCKFTVSIFLYVFLTTVIVPDSAANSEPQPCYIDLLNDPENVSPLILSSNYYFPNPVNSTGIITGSGQQLYWACPGGYFNEPGFNVNGQTVECNDGTFYTGQGHPISYENVTCTLVESLRPQLTEVHTNTRYQCELDSSRPIKIGYTINNNFASVLDVCFQTDVSIPLYARYTLTEWASFIPNHREPPTSYFYSVDTVHADVADVYSDIGARLENLGLGGYVDDTFYLRRGSLASQFEFLYTYQRDATFDLVNVAPQWDSVNNGNWRAIVSGTVKFLETGEIGDSAIVLSGTLKVSTLTNSSGEEVEVRLLGNQVPVPRWLWKILYFPEYHFGAVFFLYNNIYHEKSQADSEFFSEICNTDVLPDVVAGWGLNEVSNDNQIAGYTYACALSPARIIDPLIGQIVENILAEERVDTVRTLPKSKY